MHFQPIKKICAVCTVYSIHASLQDGGCARHGTGCRMPKAECTTLVWPHPDGCASSISVELPSPFLAFIAEDISCALFDGTMPRLAPTLSCFGRSV